MQASVQIDDPLLTFKETMKRLRISRSTLLRLIERGEIPAHKVGTQWRFYQSEVKQSVRLVDPLEMTEQGEVHE